MLKGIRAIVCLGLIVLLTLTRVSAKLGLATPHLY